ncbi:flavocytochrome c [Gracilinema caldarium]|uniref:Urocanate reductase n=1 Tax=Gracilinema caldarium (strain ATCC 51460 / DSM 7334 / H1) TaxID=744872 RepID=F8F493_GRAC1|nr:flavocytochrome c [Gracilinema caldarium]AEJ20540.1 flavocytochrome c [Gracilinema caldarium DSM 7334]
MRIKYFLHTIILWASVAFIGCVSTAPRFQPGTYEGEGKGHGGDIRVLVTVTETDIKDIKIMSMQETAFLGDTAFATLKDRILKANSTEVDVVSGATEASNGYISAVQDALNKAGFVAVKKTKTQGRSKNLPAKSYDLVIIGGGGAGLSAANAAVAKGVRVVLFEKMGILGGNTIRATGGINAAGTAIQAEKGIKDSPDLFFQDTMKGGYNKNDPELVKTLATKSAASVSWLTDMGADLSDVGRLAGASVNRAHRPSGGAKVGPEIVKTLANKAKQSATLSIFTDAEVRSLLTNKQGAVTGVVVRIDGKDYKVTAKAVVLASGGFGANNEMAAKFNPALKGFATTNHAGATGDGILMAQAIGAALVDMDQIQTHPTFAPDGNEMVTEAVRGNGAILVNSAGKRFVDELETRDVVSAKILAQEGKIAYLVFDNSVRKSLSAIESYLKAGFVLEAQNLADLAHKIGSTSETLEKTIKNYNDAVLSKKDTEYGRSDMPRTLSEAPYYAIKVTPAIHHTMGGVKINTSAQVLRTDGSVIPGLYAAGEVTGGVHGGNRLGGNALADIVTFGRIAGENAVAYIMKK